MTLVNDSLSLLDGAGVADADKLLAPLLSASLDNVLRLRDAALTGPVARGDAETLLRHRRALTQAAPQQVASYLAVARRTAERAHAAGMLDDAGMHAVLEALQ